MQVYNTSTKLELTVRFRTLVISGTGLPGYADREDIFDVAIQAIFSVTGKTVDKSMIAHLHRQGRERKRIFVE